MTAVRLACDAPVLLWRVSLQAEPDALALACLSDAERARAARFVFARDRRRYLVARCALRECLAARLGVPARTLPLVEGAFGKPALAGSATCRFNLSHSEDLALIAIGIEPGVEIGVDIEVLRTMDGLDALARAHFTAAEQAGLAALEGIARDAVFLRIWTRKEACLKAVGTGLHIEPSTVDVGCAEMARRVVVATSEGPAQVEVQSVFAGPDAVAAVACLSPNGISGRSP